jgi:predicted nucleotide-binding protein
MGLINYVGSDAFGRLAFQRGSLESRDFYENLDADLSKSDEHRAHESEPEGNKSQQERRFHRPGTSASTNTSLPREDLAGGKRYVFVVRGRDKAAYDALASLLYALDLRIVTWDDAARGAGGGTPHTLDIVRAGIEMANAVIVLMTPDDLGQVKPEFHSLRDDPREATPSGQARQNVIFEAGWAMALNQSGVVLVRVGDVRQLSDVDGLNYVRLTGDLSSRRQLVGRLRACGLAVDDTGEAWRTVGTFPDVV